MDTHLFPTVAQWVQMFFPDPEKISWVEKLVRPVLVYGFLLISFRIIGKKQLAQFTLFDFLVILLISNIVQNAMIGEDNSVLGSFAGVIIVLALVVLLDRLSGKSKKVQAVIEGSPTLLIYKGKELTRFIEQEQVTHDELMSALRRQGIASLQSVRYAILELDGSISVIKDDEPHPTSDEDCVSYDILEKAGVLETSESAALSK